MLGFAAFAVRDRITDGPFPRLSQAARYFDEHETAMTAWALRLDTDGEVAQVSCYPDRVMIVDAVDSPAVELQGQRLSDYRTLCQESGGNMMWRVDGGYLMYMGEDSRGGRDFQIAFVWRGRDVGSTPACSSVADLRDFGKCGVRLNKDWIVFYEWVPGDHDSPREKEPMELTGDVAAALSSP